jgi:ABC-2 type transport system permease protein
MKLWEFKKQIHRYLKVFFRLLKIELMTSMQYRLNFLFSFIATLSWLICELLFIHYFMKSYITLAGWNEYQIGILIGVNQLWVGGVFYFMFWPSLTTFADMIRHGEADKLFTLPVKTRFYISTFKTDWTSLFISINGLFLLIYCIVKLSITLSFLNTLYCIILISLSSWIIYCLFFITVCSVFWIVEAGSILYFVNVVDTLTRYPYEIYRRGIFFFIFTFVIPITVISNVPTRALIGILDFKFVLYEIIITVIFTILSEIIWRKGLKIYESYSS